jgi:hypothetical protein
MVAVSTEMDSVKRRLIDELEYNAEHSQQMAESRLAETAAWFFGNKDRMPIDNFASRADFLFKACWMLIETNALLLERIHELEGGKSKLWLPKGMKMSGDVKKFG